jgi:hypothetical protein
MSRQSVKFLIFLGAVIVVFLPFSILLTSCQPLDTQGIVDDLLPNL